MNDRHGVDTGLISRPQDFDNHSFTIVDVRREANHFDHDLLVGAGTSGGSVSHQDRLRKDFSVNLHQADPTLLEIGAYETMRVALYHFNNLTCRTSPITRTSLAGEPHEHNVTAGRIGRPFLRDIDIVSTVLCPPDTLRTHESIPARQATKDTGDPLRVTLARWHQRVILAIGKLAFFDEPFDCFFECTGTICI